uniref:MOSC domain-containing protein n=1 Tax=Mycena chlorophos TaxID=658473 RepID=A0ABQ0MAX1_MYCCL|nr:predicted protein [Mycena chlorophos]
MLEDLKPLLRPLLLLSIGVASVYLVSESRKRKFHIKLPFSKPDTIHGTDLRISRILVYPIKSCAGTDLSSSAFDKEGFEYDRKWMIVDLEKNKQLSARDNRGIKLVRVFPVIQRATGTLLVTFPDSPSTPSFSVPLNPTPEVLEDWDVHRGFDLWGHADEGYVVQSADPQAIDTPSEILSAYLGRPVLLVMKGPGLAPRPSENLGQDSNSLAYPGGSTVRYPDASPFLLVSDASLSHAEATVQAMARGEYERKVAGCKPDDPAPPVGEWALPGAAAKRLLMERFRPNIVVSGVLDAFGEDDWQEVVVPAQSSSDGDGRRFLLPNRCPRCMFPNVDTHSGKRDPQMPNDALMQYRKVDKAAPAKYCFGMYTIPMEDGGILRVGDPLVVTKSAVNPRITDDSDARK